MRVDIADNKPLKLALVSCIAALWLGLSGFTLYNLQTADQQIFDPRLLVDDDDFSADETANFFAQLATQARTDQQQAILVFPVDPSCQCTKAAISHLESISPTLAATGTGVLLLTPQGKSAAGEALAHQLSATTGLSVSAANWEATTRSTISRTANIVPSSPAAILLSASNDLVYFGPWSSGGACIAGIGGFVESALKAMDQSALDPVFNRAAVGCYCEWNSAAPPTI